MTDIIEDSEYIDKVGVEVECGVSARAVISGFSQEYDGSIETEGFEKVEYISDPPHGSAEDLRDKLETLYKFIADVNDSMGLHIHTSLQENQYYYYLAEMKFVKLFNTEVRESELYEDYDRLKTRDEGNQYCRRINDRKKLKQMLQGSGRYNRINFEAKQKHGTIEFRLFPAMRNAEDVMKAVKIVHDSVHSYLGDRLYADKFESNIEIEDKKEEVIHV